MDPRAGTRPLRPIGRLTTGLRGAGKAGGARSNDRGTAAPASEVERTLLVDHAEKLVGVHPHRLLPPRRRGLPFRGKSGMMGAYGEVPEWPKGAVC
jgi:hypothetical protein